MPDCDACMYRVPHAVCVRAREQPGFFDDLDLSSLQSVLAYLEKHGVEHDPNAAFNYLKAQAKQHYFKMAGENASIVKRAKLGTGAAAALNIKDVQRMMEKLADESLDQSKKRWLPIKFLLDKIDDVSCIRLEKYDTFRTHAFVRI